MGWKDDLKELGEKADTIIRMIQVVQGQAAINSKRIEAMRVVLDGQMKLQGRAADRMADRIIEMAMVNGGSPVAAASHRRTLDEKPTEGEDLWQDSPETQWPPPGSFAVTMP